MKQNITRWTAMALGVVLAAGIVGSSGTPASAAAADVLYVIPGGGDTLCEAARPCSLEKAAAKVREVQAGAPRDVTVELAGGRYRIDEPLVFAAADGGRDGATVRWTAAAGQTPVITGAKPVTGWTVSDASKNIWEAPVPVGVETRDLVVDGKAVPRASIGIAKSDVRFTQTGFEIVNPSLNWISTLPQQDRIEVRAKAWFTDRYSPVESISGTTVTMQQPAWDNNAWGYDTIPNPIFGHQTLFLENSRAFISSPGQWFIDPDAGKLYYKPADGVDPSTQEVELPRLESLISISGTLDNPVRNLRFEGLQFSGTSWLAPSSPEGLASQQAGGYMAGRRDYYPSDAISSCGSGCAAFERARTTWLQAPAAVQVSAARDIAFVRNKFVGLGQIGLGIGNDANANLSGVGLGAQGVDVIGNTFTELGGGGILAGGILADAHHPSSPIMTNSDIVIDSNTIVNTSFTYGDNSGILSTYVDGASITRNEVAELPYDAIDIGYGWGVNDPGGSQDYTDRGYYAYNPRYETPTTFRNNVVANNLVRDIKKVFADGGGIYSLSASPGTVIRENYIYGIRNTMGLYFDEGSRYITATSNVIRDAGSWIFANTGNGRNTKDNLADNTWHMGGSVLGDFSAATNNRITNDHNVAGGVWPAEARAIICKTGVPAEYRTTLSTDPCAVAPTSITGGWKSTSSAPAQFSQNGTNFTLQAAGADIWGAGGQRDDAFGAIYRAGEFAAQSTVSARVDQLGDTNAWAKTGVFIRNDATAAGSSAGYAVVAVTPARLATFQWDSNADGYLDSLASAQTSTTGALWVRLTRSGDLVRGYFSADGKSWTQLGAAVSVPGLAAAQDAGIISTSHNTSESVPNRVSAVQLTSGIDPAWYTSAASEARLVQTGPAAFDIAAAGADIWGIGQKADEYGVVAKRDGVGMTGSVTAVTLQGDTNSWAKSGVAVRNDFNAPGVATGYAAVIVTPGNGVSLQWDSNNDGYLDQLTTAWIAANRPIWTRLARNGNSVTGSYSLDGVEWTTLGSADLTGADAKLDAGVISTSHDATTLAVNKFTQVNVTDVAVAPKLLLGAEATTRTVAGKVYLSVSAVNRDTVPVDVAIATAYGNKTFKAVAPGKSVAVSFNSRLTSIPAGAATVTATGTKDGKSVTEVKSASYAAFSVTP